MKRITYIALGLFLLAGCRQEGGDHLTDQPLRFSVEAAQMAVKSESAPSAGEYLLLEDFPLTASGDTLCVQVQEEAFPCIDTVLTKASLYAGTSLPGDVSIGLMAYKYTDSGASDTQWSLHTSPAVMKAVCDNARGSASSGKWIPSGRLLWPNAGFVKYFAYAPFGSAMVSANAGAVPQLSFTVDDDYTQQTDLLVSDTASSKEYDGKPSVKTLDVPIILNHALTAIRFRIEKGFIISSIQITGVRNAGTLSLGNDRTWAVDGSSTGSYTISNPSLKDDGSLSGYDILDDKYTLLLLPQTLPPGARIIATVSDGVNTNTITAIMDGVVWEPGRLVTYSISKDSATFYTLDNSLLMKKSFVRTGWSALFDNTDEHAEILVRKTTGSVTTVGGAWKAYFHTSEPQIGDAVSSSWSETPLKDSYSEEWLNVRPTSGNGGVPQNIPNNMWIEFKGSNGRTEQTLGTSAQAMKDALRSGSGVSDLDLSTYNIIDGSTGAAETANCYVIKSHGSYLIPCVYGNAWKNGSENTSAYSNTTTPEDEYGSPRPILNNFVNADGNAIGNAVITRDPNLTNSGNLKARVVWQDFFPGFEILTDDNLEYVPANGTAVGCPYIRVSFPQDKILPGNVVIALCDEDNAKILWSWHLWVTAESLATVPVSQYSGASNNFLNVNIGWTPPISYTSTTAVRKQFAIIVSTITNKVLGSFEISQEQYSESVNCDAYSSTYYQWGRKDPFLPSSGTQNYSKAAAYNTSIPGISFAIDAYNNGNLSLYGDGPHYRPNAIYLIGPQRDKCERMKAPGSSSIDWIAWGIKNPHLFNVSRYPEYHMPDYYNLWNAMSNTISDLPVVKTVYDPSPRGFKVPGRSAFTGFTYVGADVKSSIHPADRIYGDWVEASGEMPAGYMFTTNYSPSSKTFYFPASRTRDNDSSLNPANLYVSGSYWTAAPGSNLGDEPTGREFSFSQTDVYIFDSRAGRNDGIAVRPVTDQ